MLRTLVGCSLICYCLAASHWADDNGQDGYRSFVGRHKLETYYHLCLFYAHDIAAFFSLAIFCIAWNIKKDSPYHKYVGRVLAFPLAGAIITGFLLIKIREQDTGDNLHAIASSLGRMTLSTQGYSIIAIICNAFIFKRWIHDIWFNYVLLAMHLLNVLLGFRSMHFLLGSYFGWHDEVQGEAFREVAIELLFLLTIPQILVDGGNLFIHSYVCSTGDSKKFEWRAHHEMCILHIIYIASMGCFFTIAHDQYWIFKPPGVVDLGPRMAIMMAPLIIIIATKSKVLLRPLQMTWKLYVESGKKLE